MDSRQIYVKVHEERRVFVKAPFLKKSQGKKYVGTMYQNIIEDYCISQIFMYGFGDYGLTYVLPWSIT